MSVFHSLLFSGFLSSNDGGGLLARREWGVLENDGVGLFAGLE